MIREVIGAMSTPPAPEPPQGEQQPGWQTPRPPEPGQQGAQWGTQPPPSGWGPPGNAPYPYQQPPAPPRKRRKWPWILLVVVILVIGGVIGIIASIAHEVTKSETVSYKVTGTASSATVTYTTWNNGNTSTSQQDVPLPWNRTETASGIFKGGSLIITVGAGGGTATCSVTVDGHSPSTSTATGAYSSATCDAVG